MIQITSNLFVAIILCFPFISSASFVRQDSIPDVLLTETETSVSSIHNNLFWYNFWYPFTGSRCV